MIKKDVKEKENVDVLLRRANLLQVVEEIVSLGHWDWDLETNNVNWSKNLYQIFDHDTTVPVTFDIYFNYVHPEDKDFVSKKVQTNLDNVKFEGFTHRVKLKNGAVKHIHLLAKIICNKKDEPIQIIGTCQDVTQQLADQRALLKANKLLEQKNTEIQRFISIVSHDLKAPIYSLKSLSEFLLDTANKNNDAFQKKTVNHLQKTVIRMESLVTDLLDYGRLGERAVIQKVDLNEILQENVCDLQANIEEVNAEIRFEKLPIILGYKTELRLLTQNLLSNSLKFVEEGITPRIVVEAKEDEDEWIISITDNGIGIPDEDRERVFGIFERLQLTDAEGTGIGLAHCKKIVELHDGNIWVEPGARKGTTISFTISKSLSQNS